MSTRAETAAETRQALVRVAGELLDSGGPEAVTLRAVGARAGVSRGAPYGHFASKDDLLTALAVDAWLAIAGKLTGSRADDIVSPTRRLRSALGMVLEMARSKPHLYALMFTPDPSPPEPLLAAASAAHDAFLEIVGQAVRGGDERRIGALLMSTVLGIAGMELAGQLGTEKWGTTGDDMLDSIVDWAGRSQG